MGGGRKAKVDEPAKPEGTRRVDFWEEAGRSLGAL